MSYSFVHVEKKRLDVYLPTLFQILSENMSTIAPTGNTYEEDYQIWYTNIYPAMQKAQRQIVLMYFDEILIGFFQYYVNQSTFMMEEIQIESSHQGKGVFNLFYRWLVERLPTDIIYVEAYAHKKNLKSQGILKHMGLQQLSESKNGNSLYFKGNYIDFKSHFII